MSTTTITRTLTDSPRSDEEVAAILAEPGFGRFFTDHMVTVRWNQDQGLSLIHISEPTRPY